MLETLFKPGQMVSDQVGGDPVPCMEHDMRNSDGVLPTEQCVYETPRRVWGNNRATVFIKNLFLSLNTCCGGVQATWLTKKEEQALLIFERKIFRRIYGPKYENGEWKSRTNRELEEMSK